VSAPAPPTPREVQIVVLQLEQSRRELDVLLAEVREKFGIDTEPPTPPPADLGARRRQAKAKLTGGDRTQPRWIDHVRWARECGECGVEIPAGDSAGSIFYVPGTNGNKAALYHGSCAIRAGLTAAQARTP
jgi:hypothetical protein